MNKKGSLFMAFVIAGMIFFAGVILIPLFHDQIDSVRTSLSCSTPLTITDGTKVLCLLVDSYVPYYIWIILSLMGGIILSKLQ